MTLTWNPEQYLRYGDERARPFLDLTARIGAERPGLVVDLGAGPATQTRLLAERWPGAEVLAVDSSPEMIARADLVEGLTAVHGDLRTWTPPGEVDVLVTNAALQWVPGHLDEMPRLAGMLAPGGWFAMQVPGNFDEPSHTIRRDLADQEPYAAHLQGIASPASYDAATYLRALQGGRARGRRVGDRLSPRAARPRPRLRMGLRHGRPAHPAGVAGGAPDRVRGGVQSSSARGLSRSRARGRAALPTRLRRRPPPLRRMRTAEARPRRCCHLPSGTTPSTSCSGPPERP